MTTAEYRAHGANNFSELKHLLTSVPHYLANKGKTTEPTPAMQQGTWLHQWWLEEKEPVLAVKPEGMAFNTKEGKEWKADQILAGLEIIEQDDWKMLCKRRDALNASGLATTLRKTMTGIERPMFAEIEGIPVKGLFDAENDVAFFDLKTCAGEGWMKDNSPKGWGTVIIERSYDLQWALYDAIWRENYGRRRKPKFWWITVSADKNPVVAVYNVGQFAELGREKLDTVLKRFRYWQNTGEQPIEAEVPYWAVEGQK